MNRNHRLIALGLVLFLVLAPALLYFADTEDDAETTIESLIRVKQTNYPVPDGAVHIGHDGIDRSGCGATQAPCRSIRFAVSRADAGATLVVHGGSYHEYIEFNKKLTIQAFPGDEVWIDGSQPVTDWVADESLWRRDDWRFLWTTEDGAPIGDQIEDVFIDKAYPLAGWPDMVFLDGEGLRQVGSRQEVEPGTFFVDYPGRALYVADNPADHTIEAAMLPIAMQIHEDADGTVIRGIGFRRYANPIRGGLGAMVHVHASNMAFENNTFAQSASGGFALNFSVDSVVRGNIFVANGSLGSGGYKTDGMNFENNYVGYNNTERFAYDWESGGAKMIGIRNGMIRGNIFEHNWGSGYWCDISCLNVDIVQNTVRDNDYNGVIYEISSGGLIASNLVVRNKQNGIVISGSNNSSVVNNTLVRNRRNIGVTDDPRRNTDATEIAEGNTWDTAGVEIYNNLLSDTDGTDANMDEGSNFVLISNHSDETTLRATGAGMIDLLDYNAYFRSDASRPSALFSLWTGADGDPRFWQYFPDVVAIQRDRHGFETHGIGEDSDRGNPWFVNEADDDYRLVDDARARDKGKPLDEGTAAAINAGLPQAVVQGNESVDIGALVWASFDPRRDDW